MPRRGAWLLAAWFIAGIALIGVPVVRPDAAAPALAAGTFADPHFREAPVFTGLTNPIAIRFATDGRAFVAQKNGRVLAFDSITDSTPTTVLDLRAEVHDFWDRGMLGIILDPAFLAPGRPPARTCTPTTSTTRRPARPPRCGTTHASARPTGRARTSTAASSRPSWPATR